ncbi:MAG: menaquinone biosynthesis decarboxylase [Candidatus Krumholzibacteria bacterium]|jgi:4-hydroxy-3-polyprenylbenzoate decarboxylase|nr:menaquinone biosynthesis decarboxylase [Candidatus Krumholzibacteria bacterium]
MFKYQNLRDYMDFLESRGELIRIRESVSRDLEITEICDRTVKAGGPALLFENVEGFETPLLINLFGTEDRMAWALGSGTLEEVAERVGEAAKMAPPGDWRERFRALGKLASIARVLPKTVKKAPCQDAILLGEDADLDLLPAQLCWPDDGGRYITQTQIFTKDPDTGIRNVGMYRVQIFDSHSCGMHWQMHKVGAQHHREAESRGERVEVAVVLGGHPAMIYAASAPLPEGVDEVMLAGFLADRPIEMVKAKTVDLEVPAEAEYVIEGYVEPGERRLEGPFGDHTGYYSLADDYPVLHVTAITHRKDPVYPSIVVGPPIQEDGPMGLATERIFLPLVKLQFPEIVDMHLPVEGVFHNVAIVSIRKRYPGHARKIMSSLWGTGQLMFTKVVIVVDEDVNVQNPAEVFWRVTANIDPKRDTVFAEGIMDVLDHATDKMGFGGKMGIDATRKWPEEGFEREWPDVLEMSPEVKARVDEIWDRLGISLEKK